VVDLRIPVEHDYLRRYCERAGWQMVELGVELPSRLVPCSEVIAEMAAGLWETQGHNDLVAVANVERAKEPSSGGAGTPSTQRRTAPCGGRIVVAYGRDAADVAFISNYGALETVDMKVWVDLDGSLLSS
jgi:hypothetical protein